MSEPRILQLTKEMDADVLSLKDDFRAAPPPRTIWGHTGTRAASLAADGPSDILKLPRPVPLYLSCPHCRFLCDRSKPECLACGLVFSKWATRQRMLPQPPKDWAYWLIWTVEGIYAQSKILLGLTLFLWWIWPANEHASVASSYEANWVETGGVRFRVSYLRPEGYFTVRGKGAPEILWDTYPVYHKDDMVDYQIELINLRSTPLTDLHIHTRQEILSLKGQAGTPLGEPQVFSTGVLPAGERTVFKARFKVTGRANFEQTHLSVYAAGLNGVRELVADTPWAGIVDPPMP